MDQFHPPKWTAAPHPASVHQQTHLQKQVNSQIKYSFLPNGATEEAREIGKLATNVHTLGRDVHITPSITKTSLMSTAKFANAGYTTIFDGDQVNIYDQQHDTHHGLPRSYHTGMARAGDK